MHSPEPRPGRPFPVISVSSASPEYSSPCLSDAARVLPSGVVSVCEGSKGGGMSRRGGRPPVALVRDRSLPRVSSKGGSRRAVAGRGGPLPCLTPCVSAEEWRDGLLRGGDGTVGRCFQWSPYVLRWNAVAGWGEAHEWTSGERDRHNGIPIAVGYRSGATRSVASWMVCSTSPVQGCRSRN